ncbi:signal peptide peptidase SppA [Thermococcus sp. AM4]|uniref:signal peptide peptidase SppA n=1 Tax=Thermococcus sp. (strain AM4) TaxID=246969 RepID=UPI000187096A|nr:signal peptide peptidase SppA [Thermococcus sp. AM4]EEB74322.1 protease IV [Thermococcus sp. AM4]
MKSDVWKYITFILVLILGVFVMSTTLLYLQNQSLSNYTPSNATCGTEIVIGNQTTETALQASIAELQSLIRAIEMERKGINATNSTIAVVPIFGVIDGQTALNTVTTLEKLMKDDSVGGVLLWIESPGGDVGAVREIYHEVEVLKAKKPVVAYTGGIAASGGYYIAVGTDRIIADPLAEVGSIGVIYVHFNLADNYASNGIKVDVFKTGPHKDMGAEWRALTEYERKKIWGMIDAYFQSFLQAVSMGRDMTLNETRKYATGETWLAVEVNGTLVDETGNFQTAVQELEKLMGVESAEVKVYGSPTQSYSLGVLGDEALYLDPRYLRLRG